ncbi:UNVERIFIED_CONTAM: hypothetical protein HDU68_001445, partial [Siphonaria sp. JEL0065]
YYTPRHVVDMKAKAMDMERQKLRLSSSSTTLPDSERIPINKRREKFAFTRAIDDPELKEAISAKVTDFVALVRKTFPDWKTVALKEESSPAQTKEQLQEMAKPTESPSTAHRKLRKLYHSEFEGYYPYVEDAETFDMFEYNKHTPAHLQCKDPYPQQQRAYALYSQHDQNFPQQPQSHYVRPQPHAPYGPNYYHGGYYRPPMQLQLVYNQTNLGYRPPPE